LQHINDVTHSSCGLRNITISTIPQNSTDITVIKYWHGNTATSSNRLQPTTSQLAIRILQVLRKNAIKINIPAIKHKCPQLCSIQSFYNRELYASGVEQLSKVERPTKHIIGLIYAYGTQFTKYLKIYHKTVVTLS